MEFNWSEHLPLFALGFSSLFPLINPIGTALIIEPYFQGIPRTERKSHAFKIVLNCLLLGLFCLHAGSVILQFMGVTLPAMQLAGGLIIAKIGLGFLDAKEDAKQDDNVKTSIDDALFYPLAFPLTLGPGGISTLIMLSAHAHSTKLTQVSMSMMAISLALLVVLVITYFCFAYSHDLVQKIGPNGSRVLNRLLAFLVFCIGIQMAFTGLMHMLHTSA
ncbi:MAG TPA: MarC family protein [Pseudomonadales bacterium]|nr:MarC family protein [Pseudomonadales bacterium]